ncbi:MAG: hypothetical protein ABI847_03860 [Anaerolineales bacterium]
MQTSITYAPEKTLSAWPWLMLPARLILFAALQGLLAVGLWLAGSPPAWDSAAAWWPFGVTITNVVCVWLLVGRFRAEGRSFWALFRIRRQDVRSDLWALLGVLLIAGPVAFLPNILLANWLFGDAQIALNLLVRPLPLWAAIFGLVLFPITQGLAELPTYFGYAMPRLETNGVPRSLALALPAAMLALQHLALPLVFDLRFIAWRALMFLPFAVLVAIVLHWRPRLLPYLAVVHVLMDVSFAAMLLSVVY